MLRVVPLVTAFIAPACASVPDYYSCGASSECTIEGMTGRCEPNGACSFPDPACPSGQRYGELSKPGVANVCVGSEIVENDDDMDGVENDVDKCPGVQNPTNHDEDMDGLGDECDPCPPLAETDDGDGDGVAGACDPEPNMANKIVAFLGFDTMPPSAFSTAGNGTWVYANDEATATSTGGDVAMLLHAAPGRQVMTMTNLEITSLDVSGTRVAGVIDMYDATAVRGTSCVAIRDAGGGQNLLLSDTATSASYGSVAMPVMSGITSRISATRNDTVITCTSSSGTFVGTPAAFDPATPLLGIRARGAVVKFHWLLIVGR